MKEWSYGCIRNEISNPIYDNEITINQCDFKAYELENCKVIQISYITNEKHVEIQVELDGIKYTINNSYCLDELCDTRGIGYIQQEPLTNKDENLWRVTCLIPIIFKGKGKIIIANPCGKSVKIKGVHIYYLI